VSIARKEVVDTVISTYKKAGISVIDFSLGNIVIKNLHPFISNETVYSSNAKIDFDEHTLTEIQKEIPPKENYKINDLEVSNTAILSLGGIIAYYSKNASSSISKELKESYGQKRFFDVGLKVGLGFFMLLLLINFLFFSSYRDQVGKLTGELQLSETYKNQLNSLQSEVAQKKQLVKSVNSASNSKLSKYIDEIGISVPKTILLTKIEYQPKNGIQKADKKLQFAAHKIIIKGASKENEAFTQWISFLEKTPWIQRISINEYGKGKKITATASFEFIITTHE
jgi:Tfp pilus assembly protein PilN